MARSLYLVNPDNDVPTYFGSDVFRATGRPPAVVIGDLAVTTVAALAPRDFEVRICEEGAGPIDYDCGAEIVGITGKVSQWGHMQSIAREFRRRGATVVIGGSFASLCPEVVAPHADVLVCGEVEEIAEELFADLRAGRPKPRYTGTRPDLALSPTPRWELYPNHRAFSGCVQTSRGCPFECEFCDVIQYVGRNQRHKPVDHVLRELDLLYRLGYRSVFVADDNFTAYRRRTKELLRAMRSWNRRQTRGPVSFGTQVSIDAADDEELLSLLAEAGFNTVFIGIETINEESLRESKKRQNVGVDVVEKVQRFFDHGVLVLAGMIVGFDSDGPEIFERQLALLQDACLPVASLGMLVAPAATPLHARLAAAGRLAQDGQEVVASPWATNIVPKQMSAEDLLAGMRWLASRLYEPRAFGERLLGFVDRLGPQRNGGYSIRGLTHHVPRAVNRSAVRVALGVAGMGRGEARMAARVLAALARKPAAAGFVLAALYRYRQIRHMYEVGSVFEPRLAELPAPELSAAPPPAYRAAAGGMS